MLTIKIHTNELVATVNVPDNDDAILLELISMQRDLAKYMLDVATHDIQEFTQTDRERLTQWDYSGDHDDYNPAAANALATLTSELCGSGHFQDTFKHDLITTLSLTPSSDTPMSDLGLHYDTPRSMLAALLSNDEFLEDLNTCAAYTSDMINIDFADEDDDEDDDDED